MLWLLAFLTFAAMAMAAYGHWWFSSVCIAAIVPAVLYWLRLDRRQAWYGIGIALALGAVLFSIRSAYIYAPPAPAAADGIVTGVSRRSVIVTLAHGMRTRLTGLPAGKLPLKGAHIRFVCEPYAIPESTFAVFERLSGVRSWCRVRTLETIAVSAAAQTRYKALHLLEKRLALMPGESLVRAFLLGNTEDLSAENLAAFRDMGLMHLFAVSGLNIALLFALLYVPFRVLKMPVLGGALGYTVATGFLLLLDFPVPLFRAWLFLTIGMAGRLLDRRMPSWSLLFLTALVVEAVIPLSTFTISFVLSFSITGAILLFYEPLYFCFGATSRPGRLLTGHAALTFSAGLPAFVLSFFLFGAVQPLALLYNLLLVPFSGLYLLLSLLFIAYAPAAVLLRPLDNLYAAAAGLHTAMVMPLAGVPTPVAAWVSVSMISSAMLFLLYLQYRQRLWSVRRRWKTALGLLAAVLALPWVFALRPAAAFYATPNRVWYFSGGMLTVAGKNLFPEAREPQLCLRIRQKVDYGATANGGVLRLGSACIAFSASLDPGLWRYDQFHGCTEMHLFQSRKRHTSSTEWQQLLALFGFRGKLHMREYFTWYADKPLTCAQTRLL